MSWRTVIITERAKLDYRLGYMVVRGNETRKVLIDEIKILLVENPAVSLTGFLIEALIEKKVKVIFCDSKHNPISEMLPHHGCHDVSAKIRMQMEWSHDIKARVWREIVMEKIRKQSDLLRDVNRINESELLDSYISQVELSDATNREGHAAKVYFNALFGMKFTRSEESPINAALNYGYSMLLSAFNREISANGYLTQLGIFHGNMFNPYNLGCDLMETFRVIVDRYVFEMKPLAFEKEEKHSMWNILDGTILIDGTRQTVANGIRIYVKSVFDAINDEETSKIRNYSIVKQEI